MNQVSGFVAPAMTRGLLDRVGELERRIEAMDAQLAQVLSLLHGQPMPLNTNPQTSVSGIGSQWQGIPGQVIG